MSTDFYEEYWSDREDKDWFPSSRDNVNPVEQKLFGRIGEGDSVVDYGCGNGERYGRGLAERGVVYRGADISEAATKSAAELGLEVRLLDSAGVSPYEDGSADFVICFEVLEHLMDTEAALREFSRLLKPGGEAIVSVPNAGHFVNRIEFLLTGFLMPGGGPITARKRPWMDPHIRFFTPRTLRRMFAENGFEVVETKADPYRASLLPGVWKRPGLARVFDFLGAPLRFLGSLLPGIFSARIFLVARSTEAARPKVEN